MSFSMKKHIWLLRILFVSDSGYCLLVHGAFRERNLDESLELGEAGAGEKDLGVDSANWLRRSVR